LLSNPWKKDRVSTEMASSAISLPESRFDGNAVKLRERGGGKNFVDWEGWEDSTVLLMTGQPIPPMYVFSEIKVERLTSHES